MRVIYTGRDWFDDGVKIWVGKKRNRVTAVGPNVNHPVPSRLKSIISPQLHGVTDVDDKGLFDRRDRNPASRFVADF